MSLVLAVVAGPAAVAAESSSMAVLAERVDLPESLRDTGLFVGRNGTEVRRGLIAFSPQYPLWTDGASKRRWLYLPSGTSIDASDPQAWRFPRGTRLWKQFSFDGRPVETRFIERLADGRWRFASYVWNAAGTDARLAPAAGTSVRWAAPAAAVHRVPGRTDCLACHESAPSPVLGASALQLSGERDPLAPHADRRDGDLDLSDLIARGLVTGWPADRPMPRIAARGARERAALGYLHGNCGHCHNRSERRVPLRLTLAQGTEQAIAEMLRSTVLAPSRFRAVNPDPDAGIDRIVVPGQPAASLLAVRMRSTRPQRRMPPLGTDHPDREGLALVEAWISSDLSQLQEPLP